MNNLIEKIQALLDKDSPNLAAIMSLLSNLETRELSLKFDGASETNINNSELIFKAEALTSLLLIILDNPKIKTELKRSPKSPDLVRELKKITYEISRGCLEHLSDTREKIFWLTKVVLLGITADRNPEVDLLIKEKQESIFIDSHNPVRDDLENITYKLILRLVKRIENNDDITHLRGVSEESQRILDSFQNEQLSKESIDLSESLRISGLANLLFLLKITSEYLITGRALEDVADIDSLIDSYCFNALKLFSSDNKDLYLISILLRLALKQLTANSIWKIVGRSPVFKNYFDNNQRMGKDLILTLLPSQRNSILQLLTAKKSIVLDMPTSSGKSLLAELYILFNLHNYKTSDSKPTAVYVVPTNALTNQVYHRLREVFSGLSYRIETALPYYQVDEIEDEILKQDHLDVLITTPEKLDFLIRKDHVALRNLRLVVVDEAHMLADESRGAKLELLLATIKQKREEVNFLLLSPFITNAKEISVWLAGSEESAEAVASTWTPTKQFIGCNLLMLNKTKSVVRYLPSARNNIVKEPLEIDLHLNPSHIKDVIGERRVDSLTKVTILVQKYISIGSVMVLCGGAGSTEKMASKIAGYLKENRLLTEVNDEELDKAIELIKQESLESDELIACLKLGVAFHHSKMPALIKETIENLIKARKIKLIFATTTLAQGLNFPITTVLFDSLTLGGGKSTHELTTAEFLNIAGRAGRAFMDNEGHIVTPYIAGQAHSEKLVKNYIRNDISKITSSLNEMLGFLENQDVFEYRFIKNNPNTSNFFQYLSHILNVTYDYDLNRVDTTKIRNILNSSLFFNELSFEEGFIESQERVSGFAFRYVTHLRERGRGELKMADIFGVSDITFKRFNAVLQSYKHRIIEVYGRASVDEYLKASQIILQTKDKDKLTEIVRIVSQLPEIKLALQNRGSFNPENIAKIIIGWVGGKKINEIVNDIAYPDADRKKLTGDCNQYVNSNLKTYVPWGLSIFQALTDDLSSTEAKNLPSYIYYGVNNKEAVILSKLGVPRFAVNIVKQNLREQHSGLEINIRNASDLKQAIRSLPSSSYSTLNGDINRLKSIVDDNL